MIISAFLVTNVPTTVFASKATDATLDQTLEAYLWAKSLQNCIRAKSLIDVKTISFNTRNISSEHAEAGQWFAKDVGDKDAMVQSGVSASCADTQFSRIASVFGYSDTPTAMIEMGFKLEGRDYYIPISQTDMANQVWNRLSSKWGGLDFPMAVRYKLLYSEFTSVCGASETTSAVIGNSDMGVKINVPDGNGGVVQKIFKLGKSKSDTIDISPRGDGGMDRMSCGDIANELNRNAAQYSRTAKDLGAKAGELGSTPGGTKTSDGKTDCSPNIGALGWIVCPVTKLIADTSDKAFEFLSSNFLSVHSELFNTQNGTYIAWSAFRNYANVAFVLVFIIIIMSQITSVGINNYGIKRMLPRLLVAAVLVNVSYFLCQIAVDISNILGYSIKQLFDNISVGGQTGVGGLPLWKDIMSKVLAGAGIALTLILLLLALGGPVLIACALAILMIVIILIAREAAVVLLVAVSPLAFVAYLLPNTEQWFKKWWKMLSALLMVFPVVGAVFGASSLAARILNSTAQTAGSDTQTQITLQITALAMAAIPLFIVPSVLKGAMAATGSVGAWLGGMSNRVNKGIGKGVRTSRLGEAVDAQKRRMEGARVERRIGKGFIGKANSKLDNSRVGRFIGGDRGAAAAIAAHQRSNREQIDNKVALLENQPASIKLEKAQDAFISANASKDDISARAAAQVLRNGGTKGKDMLHESIIKLESQPGGINEDVAEGIKADNLVAGVKGYDAALDMWSTDKAGNTLKEWSTSTTIKTIDQKGNVQVKSNGAVTRLNQNELGGQSSARLEEYLKNGLVTSSQVQSTLASYEKGTLPLDEKKADLLRAYIRKNPPQSTPESTQRTQNSQTPPTSQPNETIPTIIPQSASNNTPDPRDLTQRRDPTVQVGESVQMQGQSFDKSDGGLYIPRDNQ